MFNGCIYLQLDRKGWNSITGIFEEEYLYYNDEESFSYGIEKEPHITLLYGLESESFNDKEFYKVAIPIKDYNIDITGVGLFENEKYHVLHFTVNCDELYEQNQLIKDKFEYKNDYPIYSPHITIAYLKPNNAMSIIYRYLLQNGFTYGAFSYNPIPKKYIYSAGLKKKISFVK